MFGKAEMINTETLKKIRQNCTETKIALWHVDAIYYHKEIEHITDQLQYLDKLFITSGGKNLDAIRKKFPKKVFFFPNPVDNSIDYHQNFLHNKFNYDVVFCGRDHNRPERRQYFQDILNKAKKNHQLFIQWNFR